MKKLFFMLALVAMSVLAMGQDNQLVWANGRLLYGTPVESIDSLTYDEMEDVDTLHLLLPRTLVKVVHDTVYIHDTVYVETDCGDEIPSAGIGVFSVSADKKVTFSKGNLQYTQSTNTWSFAENQYDYIGTDNVTGGDITSDPTYGDSKEGTALADKVDLFGWSTSATNFGVSTSTDDNDYSGSFVDWGTNQIGADAPNTWRTLTEIEWEYLLNNRPNASSLKGVAQVNGVNGLIFLPDNWTCPAGVTFKSGFHSSYGVDYYAAYQTFTADQWSKLEAAGAVFLPASSRRDGSDVYHVQYDGYYWSATEDDSDYAYCLNFYSDEAYMISLYRNRGQSVRLVKDIEGGGATPDTPDTPDTPTEPEEPTNPSAGIGTFSVSADKQVTFSQGNLQYTQSTNTWSFAENQYDYIGTDNVTGGDVTSNPTSGDSKSGAGLADKIDLFGWSTSATNFGVSTSTDGENDYLGSFVDWGTNKIGNDAPNTWRTLNSEEWSYLRFNRTHADDLVGVAQINGVNGLIFLPDTWVCPKGITFKSGFHSDYSVEAYGQYQTFTAEQWSKLESAGAVFLPAAGYRFGSSVYSVLNFGKYWSATEPDNNFAYYLLFYSDGAYMGSNDRYYGLSVRLVKDL